MPFTIKLMNIFFVLFLSGCFDRAEKVEVDNYFERHIAENEPGIKEQANTKKQAEQVSENSGSTNPHNQEVPRSEPSTNENVSSAEIKKGLQAVSETQPKGFCDVESNLQQMYAANHSFAEEMADCVVSDYWNMSAYLDVQCVSKKYSAMTTNCLNCFADLTRCTADNCKSKCAPSPMGYGKRSLECKKCSWYSCGEQMKACTGLPLRLLPDFQR